MGGDGAADPARDPVGLRRLDLHRADALRRLLRRLDRRAARARGALANCKTSGTASARSSCTACCRCRSGWRWRGIVAAWYCYLVNPALPARIKSAAGPLYTLLDNKYYFDHFNDWFFAGGARAPRRVPVTGSATATIIDGFFVNGSARLVGWAASLLRHLQSGYVYHYAFTMIIGLFALLTWWVGR